MRFFGILPIAVVISVCTTGTLYSQQYCTTDLNKELSVVCKSNDVNGSPEDPDWAGHVRPGGELPLRDHNDKCFHDPDDSSCTEQLASRDPAPVVSFCTLGCIGCKTFVGHVNWTPATYEGSVGWLNFAFDSDINLQLIRSDQCGITHNNVLVEQSGGQRRGVHSDAGLRLMEVEFAAGETMARFATDWWSGLYEKIQQANDEEQSGSKNAYDIVRQQLHPACPIIAPKGVVYGLMGLDCVHDCRSEIHPAYVVALQVDGSPESNKWAVFARNWGNEGSCSSQKHPLKSSNSSSTPMLQVLLPHTGSGTPELVRTETQFASTHESIEFPKWLHIPGQGLLLTFTLTDPAERDLAELFLTIKWSGEGPDTSDCAASNFQQRRPSDKLLQESRDGDEYLLRGKGKNTRERKQLLDAQRGLAQIPTGLQKAVRRPIPSKTAIESATEIPKLKVELGNATVDTEHLGRIKQSSAAFCKQLSSKRRQSKKFAAFCSEAMK